MALRTLEEWEAENQPNREVTIPSARPSRIMTLEEWELQRGTQAASGPAPAPKKEDTTPNISLFNTVLDIPDGPVVARKNPFYDPGIPGDPAEQIKALQEVYPPEFHPGVDWERFRLELAGEGVKTPLGLDHSRSVRNEMLSRNPKANYSMEAPAVLRQQAGAFAPKSEQRENFWKQAGYEVSYDPGGRLLLTDPNTGMTFPENKGGFTGGDLAEWSGSVVPELSAIGIATALTVNRGRWFQIGADVVATGATSLGKDLTAKAFGYELKDPDEILVDAAEEGAWAGGFHLAGRGVASIANRINNPLQGGVTENSKRILSEISELNESRRQEGLPPIKIPVSALNESPMLGRYYGFASKMPFGGWVIKKVDDQFQKAIDHEIDIITRDLQGIDKEKMSNYLQDRLRKLHMENLRKYYEDFGLRPTTAARAGRAIKDSVEEAKDYFLDHEVPQAIAPILDAAGDRKFPARNYMTALRKALEERKDVGGDPFIQGLLDDLTERKSEMGTEMFTFQELWNIKKFWGEKTNATQTITSTSKGQMAMIYGALAADMKAAKIPGWEGFVDWYEKQRRIFSDSKNSPLPRIMRGFENNPEALSRLFLRQGKATELKLLRQTISDDAFNTFAGYAMTHIFNPVKNPSNIIRTMDTIGDEALVEIFGRGVVTEMKKSAQALKTLSEVPINRFLSQRKTGEELLNGVMTQRTVSHLMTVRKMLNPEEFKLVQLSLADKIIRDSMTKSGAQALGNEERAMFGVLDGRHMLNIMKNDYGDEYLKKAFAGTDLYTNLLRLANITTAKQAPVKDSAGGLASGMVIAAMLTGAALTEAVTLGASSWVAAKLLTSPNAANWLTRDPITNNSRAMFRYATEAALWMASEGQERDVAELRRGIENFSLKQDAETWLKSKLPRSE